MCPDTATPTRPLTIAYVGNYRAPWCTEVHVASTLEALGHTVHRWQEDELHAGTLGADGWDWRDVPDAVAEVGADLLLWTRTWAAPHPDMQRAALDALADRGVPTAAYHLDLYLGTVRERQITDEPWWQSQHLFTPDQRLDTDDRTAGRHHWMPPAVYEPETGPGTVQPQFTAEVGFVGTVRGYHPEWRHRRDLVTNVQTRYGRRFARWPRGNDPVRGQALNDLYASVGVLVGDSYGAGTIPGYWSDRIPETLGRGGVLVHPNVPGLAEQFTPGEHLATWDVGDWDGLYATIDGLLADPDRRDAMRAAAVEHVRARHTYTVRLRQVLGHIVDAHPELGIDGTPRPKAPPKDTTRTVQIGAGRIPVALRGGTTDSEVFREVWDLGAYADAVPYLHGATVLDVGANVGAFTLWALSKGARLVHAYEPEPGNADRLVVNTGKLGDRVEVHRVAVGPDEGELYLAPGPDATHGGGTHVYSGGEPEVDADLLARVPVRPVDLVLRHAIDAGGGELGVWKMDVEGAEYAIVAAMEESLLAHVRCLVMEFHGPGMPHLPHLRGADDLGPLLTTLAEYGRLDVLGRPSVGGNITWRRY